MEKYIRRDLTEEDRDIMTILDERPIREILATGCFLAGGSMLASTFGKRKPIEEYLKHGDIDFFAPSEEAHKAASVVFGMLGFTTSGMKVALNTHSSPSKYKLQLVNSSYGGPMEEVLEKFDVANCKVATDGRQLIYHRDVPDLERDLVMRLDRSPGFMLAWRVVKYMNRGYQTLHPDSREFIIEWFINLRTKHWDLADASRKYFRYSHHQIRDFLRDRRLVHDEDLLLAINAMHMVVGVIQSPRSMYDDNEELVKDLAREELERRLGTKLNLPEA
jgi:hypothetical protein